MESPEFSERQWFAFWREQQGWPMIPKEMLDAGAELIREAEANEGIQYTFCDVPIQHLNLQEAHAALAMMYHHAFRLSKREEAG
jgi:hypothetical protein